MLKDGIIYTGPLFDRISPGPLGVRRYERPRCHNGYTLFSTALGNTEYLVDMNGMVVHTWPCTHSQLAELLPNGNLLVDNYGNWLEEKDPDGNTLWMWKEQPGIFGDEKTAIGGVEDNSDGSDDTVVCEILDGPVGRDPEDGTGTDRGLVQIPLGIDRIARRAEQSIVLCEEGRLAVRRDPEYPGSPSPWRRSDIGHVDVAGGVDGHTAGGYRDLCDDGGYGAGAFCLGRRRCRRRRRAGWSRGRWTGRGLDRHILAAGRGDQHRDGNDGSAAAEGETNHSSCLWYRSHPMNRRASSSSSAVSGAPW